LLIERAECGGGAEHQVGGVFHLHQALAIASNVLSHKLHIDF
jgi:hypothetical protein